MTPERQRLIYGILAVIGGTLIHFTFGHFYTIANMVPYIMGYTKSRVDHNVKDELSIWLSALALGSQGISMPLGGLTAKKMGFRFVVGLSCLLVSGGVGLTYFTITRSFPGVMITYALIVGLGLGYGYAVVLGVASSWFPERRGLVVGIIVGGFGLGALIFTPIQTLYINPNNIKVDNVTRHFTDPVLLDRVPSVFLLLGGLLFTIQVIGFLLLRPRPEEPKETEEQNAPGKGPWNARPVEHKTETPSDVEVPPKKVIRCIDFYLLWIVMFCNIIPITIITSAYKLFGQNYISDDRFLSAVVTVSALFNCGGRIFWGYLVDRLSFKIPISLQLTLWALILLTFPHLSYFEGATLKVFYTIWVCGLFISISGVFAMMPAATSILFGHKNMPINYGLVFNAFVFGTLVCGAVTTLVKAKHAYFFQFTACGCVCLCALFTLIWIQDRKMNPRFNICRWCSTRCPGARGSPDDEEAPVEMVTRN